MANTSTASPNTLIYVAEPLHMVSSGPCFSKTNVPGIYRVIQEGTSLSGV